jgi:hypothetical protein
MKLDLKSIHFLTQYNFVGDPMQVQIQAPNPALLFPILVHILHYQQGVVGCLSLWCTQQNNKKKKLHFKKPAEGAQPFFFPKPAHQQNHKSKYSSLAGFYFKSCKMAHQWRVEFDVL